jgi:hypothetical protein
MAFRDFRQAGYQAGGIARGRQRSDDMGETAGGKRASRQRAERIAGGPVRADAQKGHGGGLMAAADLRQKSAKPVGIRFLAVPALIPAGAEVLIRQGLVPPLQVDQHIPFDFTAK